MAPTPKRPPKRHPVAGVARMAQLAANVLFNLLQCLLAVISRVVSQQPLYRALLRRCTGRGFGHGCITNAGGHGCITNAALLSILNVQDLKGSLPDFYVCDKRRKEFLAFHVLEVLGKILE